MALTAEQYSELASAHERAAADPFVSAAQRAGFAKKAEFYRLGARLAAKLAAKKSASGETRNSTSKDGAGCWSSGADSIRLERPLPSADGTRSQTERTQAEADASASLQAVKLLAIRWRLFQLASEPLPLPDRSPPAERSEH